MPTVYLHKDLYDVIARHGGNHQEIVNDCVRKCLATKIWDVKLKTVELK